MEQFHVITGLPRTGSTLLCNVLNQNPRFAASRTSPLPRMLRAISDAASASESMRSLLAKDDGTYARLRTAGRMFALAWYENVTAPIVFDKARMWAPHVLVLADLFPAAKIIVTVRDLRAIAASVERQHAKNPILSLLPAQTLHARIDAMLGPQGVIGSCVPGVVDLKDRRLPNVFVFDVDVFSRAPTAVMAALYEFLGEAPFSHDFERVVNAQPEADGFWLDKFPHDGNGAVTPAGPRAWEPTLPPDLARAVYAAFPRYNQLYGYLE